MGLPRTSEIENVNVWMDVCGQGSKLNRRWSIFIPKFKQTSEILHASGLVEHDNFRGKRRCLMNNTGRVCTELMKHQGFKAPARKDLKEESYLHNTYQILDTRYQLSLSYSSNVLLIFGQLAFWLLPVPVPFTHSVRSPIQRWAPGNLRPGNFCNLIP